MKIQQVLSGKLLKHNTTRKLGKKLSSEFCDEQQGDDQLDDEQRECLEWERRLVDALLRYMDIVPAAFEALMQAHEALAAAGIEHVESAAPLLETLAGSTVKANRVMREAVSKDRRPLEMLKVALGQYAEDVQKADQTAAEYQRYTSKVESLAETEYDRRESGKLNKKDDARLARNKDKMDNASRTASVAHVRAVDALKSCCLKRENLCNFADRLVSAASTAFCQVWSVAGRADSVSQYPASCNPFEEEAGLVTASAAPTCTIAPMCTVEIHNPFSEDIIAASGKEWEGCKVAPSNDPVHCSGDANSQGVQSCSAPAFASQTQLASPTSEGHNPFSEATLSEEERSPAAGHAPVFSEVTASPPAKFESDACNPFSEQASASEVVVGLAELNAAPAPIAHGTATSAVDGGYSLEAIFSAASPGAVKMNANPFEGDAEREVNPFEGDAQQDESSRYGTAQGWK